MQPHRSTKVQVDLLSEGLGCEGVGSLRFPVTDKFDLVGFDGGSRYLRLHWLKGFMKERRFCCPEARPGLLLANLPELGLAYKGFPGVLFAMTLDKKGIETLNPLATQRLSLKGSQ